MMKFDVSLEKYRQFEFKQHLALSLGVTICVVFISLWLNYSQKVELTKEKTKFQNIENEFQNRSITVKSSLNLLENSGANKNFYDQLISNNKSDEIVRQMSRLAAEKGIHLDSLKIVPTAATVNELGKVQYTVTLKTDYYLFKGWLSGMLSRYPALGVNTLSIRGLPNDNTKQDINLSMLLYLKD
jgi:Tfp pilus assembly protein PilO